MSFFQDKEELCNQWLVGGCSVRKETQLQQQSGPNGSRNKNVSFQKLQKKTQNKKQQQKNPKHFKPCPKPSTSSTTQACWSQGEKEFLV